MQSICKRKKLHKKYQPPLFENLLRENKQEKLGINFLCAKKTP